MNTDSDFDSNDFHSICNKWEIIPNGVFDCRTGENKDEYLFDDLPYVLKQLKYIFNVNSTSERYDWCKSILSNL